MLDFLPSGGWVYHWRAKRNHKLWEGFCFQLQTWLKGWSPKNKDLLLIAPSGGYTLPAEWLLRFSKVYAVDLDGSAEKRFQQSHPQLVYQWIKQDIFTESRQLSTHPLQHLLDRYPEAAVLFCNVLGQLPLNRRISEIQFTQYLQALRSQLRGRSWASYHDLYSIDGLNVGEHPSFIAHHLQTNQWKEPRSGRLEVCDHLTSGRWTDGLQKTKMFWSLHKKRLHVIEGVYQKQDLAT